MMRNKLLYILPLFTLLSTLGFAQRDIEPTLLFSDNTKHRFTGEWQYLSTDIYLLIGDKFSTLINGLNFVRAKRDILNMQDFIEIDSAGKESSIVDTLNSHHLSTKNQTDDSLDLVCTLKPELCRVPEEAQFPTPRKRPTTAFEAFSSDDPVIRQSNVFIAIFEFQVNNVLSKNDISESISEKIAKASNTLNLLKVAVDLYSDQLSQPQKLESLEADINSLVREVSDILSEIENQIQ